MKLVLHTIDIDLRPNIYWHS